MQPTRVHSNRRPLIDSLEARRLFVVGYDGLPPVSSATPLPARSGRACTADDGIANVVATGDNDAINVDVRDNVIHVNVNGTDHTVAAAEFISSRSTAGDGNDSVTINSSLPAYVFGGLGDDSLTGGSGNDTLTGAAGKDLISGGTGNDRHQRRRMRDRINGNDGSDRLYGGDANDLLDGGTGVDRLWGEAGDDFLNGGSSNDKCYGGDGNDHLHRREAQRPAVRRRRG